MNLGTFWLRADNPPETGGRVLCATLRQAGQWSLTIGKWDGHAWVTWGASPTLIQPQPDLWTLLYPPLSGHEEMARAVQQSRALRQRPYPGPAEHD